MSKFYDTGVVLGRVISGARKIRFLPATNNYEALLDFPAFFFEAYDPADPERMYERGEVLGVPGGLVSKYLLTGDGRVDPAQGPQGSSLCRLFRDRKGIYDWEREEYCSYGALRVYEGYTYRLTAANAGDNNTPPPNMPQIWEKVT